MTTTRRSIQRTELFDMTFIQIPKMEIMEITEMIFIKGNLQYAAIRISMKHEVWKILESPNQKETNERME